MEDDLLWSQALASIDVAQQLAGPVAAFCFEHLPADDLATKQVEKQVEIVEPAFDGCGQVGNIPAVELIGCGGAQGFGLGARLTGPFAAAVFQLLGGSGCGRRSIRRPDKCPGRPGAARFGWAANRQTQRNWPPPGLRRARIRLAHARACIDVAVAGLQPGFHGLASAARCADSGPAWRRLGSGGHRRLSPR